jgi:hypothetical protein
LGPVTGSWTGENPLVDALNSAEVVPLCQVTALAALTGSTSTASSSPACGHCAPAGADQADATARRAAGGQRGIALVAGADGAVADHARGLRAVVGGLVPAGQL